MKLVTDYYSDKEIEEAKESLYQHFSGKTCNKRKGDTKSELNVKDLLELFHYYEAGGEDSSSLPNLLCVTATTNFPPVDLKSIDAAAWTQNLCSLRRDFEQYKVTKDAETCANTQISTQIGELRAMVSHMSAVLKKGTVNKQFEKELKTMTKSTGTSPNTSCKNDTAANHDSDIPSTHNDIPGNSGCTSLGQTSYSEATAQTYSEVLINKGQDTGSSSANEYMSCRNALKKIQTSDGADSNQPVTDGDRHWIEVKRNKKSKPSHRSNIGKLVNTGLKTITRKELPAEVFISRLDPATSAEDINTFVQSQFSKATEIVCTKLAAKYDSYSSFKVTMKGVGFKESLNANHWPSGILLKRFFSPSKALRPQDRQKSDSVHG